MVGGDPGFRNGKHNVAFLFLCQARPAESIGDGHQGAGRWMLTEFDETGLPGAEGVEGGCPAAVFVGPFEQKNLMGGGVGVCASAVTVCHGVCAGGPAAYITFYFRWEGPKFDGRLPL